MFIDLHVFHILCFRTLHHRDDEDLPVMDEEQLQSFLEWAHPIIDAQEVHEQFQNDLQRHIGPDSTYNKKTSILLSLNILYRAFLKKQIKSDLIFNIVDQARKCTHGFDSALQMYIIEQLRFPQDLEDLLAIARQNFVKKFAIQTSSDVHIQNQIFMFASQHFYTQASNPDDPSHMDPISFTPFQQDLEYRFNQFYNVFQIIHELENIIGEWIQHSGYQAGTENDLTTIELIEQLFKNIFSPIPPVKNLLDFEQHEKEKPTPESLKQQLFDFLDQTNIKEENLETLTTIFSDTESAIFNHALTAEQQTFITQTKANHRHAPLRCFQNIKDYLKEQNIPFGSNEMIWENLTSRTPRASFKLWQQHISTSLNEALNNWKQKFLETQQLSFSFMKQHLELKQTFHDYFWDNGTLNQQNIRLAIWNSLLIKNYVQIEAHYAPFITKLNEIIQGTYAQKLVFFQKILHFHHFSEQNLYLFKFLGLSENTHGLQILHHFLKDFWFSHLFKKDYHYKLAHQTVDTYKYLGYQPPNDLLKVFTNARFYLKNHSYSTLITLVKIIDDPNVKLEFIKAWSIPRNYNYMIKLLYCIPQQNIRLELIQYWNIEPKKLALLYQIIQLISHEQRLAYIIKHIELFKNQNIRVQDIQEFSKSLNDRDKVTFLKHLIEFFPQNNIIKEAHPLIIPLFRTEAYLKQYLHLFLSHFIDSTEQIKQLFINMTDEEDFNQIISHIPKLYKTQIEDIISISGCLNDERKIRLFSQIISNHKVLFDFILRFLETIESEEQRMHFLKMHIHLIYVDILGSILNNFIHEKKHHHELIIILFQQTRLINNEMCFKVLEFIPQAERFELLNQLFEIPHCYIQLNTQASFQFIFGPSITKEEMIHFLIENPQMLTSFSLLIHIMNDLTSSQKFQWLTQCDNYLLSLCRHPHDALRIFTQIEKNIQFKQLLSKVEIKILINIIFLPQSLTHPEASERLHTSIFLFEYLLETGQFLIILQTIKQDPSLIKKMLYLLNPEMAPSCLFNEQTMPFFKHCSWIYTLLLQHLSQAQHILEQHHQEKISTNDLVFMLSTLKSVPGSILKPQDFYFIISHMKQNEIILFFKEHPKSLSGLIEIFYNYNSQFEFFTHLDLDKRIELFEILVTHNVNPSILNIFDSLLEQLPKPLAKNLFLKYLTPTAYDLMSLHIFKKALKDLDVNIMQIEPYSNIIEQLLVNRKSQDLESFFEVYASQISTAEQAKKWLSYLIELSNIDHLQKRTLFWQFYNHLANPIKKQTMLYFIQNHSDIFWNKDGFHKLFIAENSLKIPFFKILIENIDIFKQSVDFNQFIGLYLEIKSKSKSKDYTPYKILFLEAYGEQLFKVMPKSEQMMMLLNIEPDNISIFTSIQKYLHLAPSSYINILFMNHKSSFHQNLLLSLSDTIQKKCAYRLDYFSFLLIAIERSQSTEEVHEFIIRNQENIKKMRFFDFYLFQAWNSTASEIFFHDNFFHLIQDAIIEILNQNYDFLVDFIKTLSLKNHTQPIEHILLNPKLTCLQTLEQVLVLRKYLSPIWVIKNLLTKSWSSDEILSAMYLCQNDILIKTFLELRLSNDTELLKIFINPQQSKEDFKLNLIEDCQNQEIKSNILKHLEILDYLELDHFIIMEFQKKVMIKASQSHMHFFINPHYQQLYDIIQGRERYLSQENLRRLKNDPELRAYFYTSAIRVYIEKLMEQRRIEYQERPDI